MGEGNLLWDTCPLKGTTASYLAIQTQSGLCLAFLITLLSRRELTGKC